MNWLKAVLSPVSEVIGFYRDKKQAEHNRDMAVINSQAKQAENAQTFESAWELANLKDNDKTLRRVSYVMFSSPIFLAALAPERAETMIDNINRLPPWMIETFIGINGAVWGIASLKKVVPDVITSVRAALKKGGRNG